MKVIALATSHNRKIITLRALASLLQQSLPRDCELEICLVDDGSTDGTAAAVRSEYPDVNIVEGAGDLFWAGGMRYGWEQYVQHQVFDYLLVFNDDVELYPNAIVKLLSAASELEADGATAFVVAGAFSNPDTGGTSYGGVVRKSWWHPLRFKKINPGNELQECATSNMNLTLISHKALSLVGFLSPEFVHKAADYDFGLRLSKAGGKVVLASSYVGECHTNPVSGTVYEPGILFRERWRRLTSIKGNPPKLRALYYRRHGGRFWFIFWALSYLRIIFVSSIETLKILLPSKHLR